MTNSINKSVNMMDFVQPILAEKNAIVINYTKAWEGGKVVFRRNVYIECKDTEIGEDMAKEARKILSML